MRSRQPVVGVVLPLVALLTCVAALVAVTGGTASTSGDRRDGTTRHAGTAKHAKHAKQAASGRRTGAVAPERPLRTVLPSGRTVTVRAVSTTRDGTLAVPGDIDVAGWWRGGSRVGDPFGSVLLSAHVDSASQGLGPYAELLTVRRGQRVVVTTRHLRQVYVVRSLRLLRKGALSDHRWVYSARGRNRLTMVTCAGPYVRRLGGYQRLAVVTATPVSRPTRRGA